MKDLRIDAAETTAKKFTRELLAYNRRFKKGFRGGSHEKATSGFLRAQQLANRIALNQVSPPPLAVYSKSIDRW